MEGEYADLLNEAVHVTNGAAIRRAYTGTIRMLRALYESDPNWIERTPTCFAALKHTWLMTAVTEITGKEDSDRWLSHQCDDEDFQHQQKTPARMEEIASISGLARIMFTSTVTKQWISPVVKAYWYACVVGSNGRRILSPRVNRPVIGTPRHGVPLGPGSRLEPTEA